jgi:hypothetical protein
VYIRIPPRKISLLRFLVEGYDGLAIVSTIDAADGLVRLLLPRSRYGEMLALLSALSRDILGNSLAPEFNLNNA